MTLDVAALAHEAATAFDLGPLRSDPVEVPGGNSHRMLRLDTRSGAYAVKVLRRNPDDSDWLRDYLVTVDIERAASDAGVDCPQPVPAAGGDYVVELPTVESTTVRVHRWVDGPTATSAEVDHPRIGALLRSVHDAGRLVSSSAPLGDWFLSARGASAWQELADAATAAHGSAEWARSLAESVDVVVRADALVLEAREAADDTVLSHRDLTPKNVIAADRSPFLCDWDAAGPHVPWLELVVTAMVWGGAEERPLEPRNVHEVMRGYAGGDDYRPIDRPSDFGAWLFTWVSFTEFNVRRRLGMAGPLAEGEDAAREMLIAVGCRAVNHIVDNAERWVDALAAERAKRLRQRHE